MEEVGVWQPLAAADVTLLENSNFDPGDVADGAFQPQQFARRLVWTASLARSTRRDAFNL
jgi:hypothetical protein